MNDVCPQHSGIEKTLESHGEVLTEIKTTLVRMFEKLDTFLQRPSWVVCTVMTAMGGIIGAETTFILYSYLVHKGT
jgi:hypothetical protein